MSDTTATTVNTSVDPNRRAILVGAGVAAALSAAGPVFGPREALAAVKSEAQGLISAAEHCEDVGDACLSHCFNMFKAGDMALAECARVVDDTIAVCAATAKLGNNNSSHVKRMAGICQSVCEDCEKECLKHAEKHDICKEMADACNATIEECKKFAA